MNDPDNFLGRWSRRKREVHARQEQARQEQARQEQARHEENVEARATINPAEDRKPQPGEPDQAAPAPAFDADLLPPIDSIDAGSDISDFLRPGVPEALRHAALRRVWSADPTIRDFVGINENYWDAAGPDGVPGFGALDPDFDVKRMVSELFGERREPAVPDQPAPPMRPSEPDARDVENQPVPSTSHVISEAAALPGAPEKPAEQPVSDAGLVSQRNENVAMQIQDDNKTGRAAPVANPGRRHGGAMPQ